MVSCHWSVVHVNCDISAEARSEEPGVRVWPGHGSSHDRHGCQAGRRADEAVHRRDTR